jgi:hypothetical protein
MKKLAVVFNSKMFKVLKDEVVSILNASRAIDRRNPA